MTKCNAMRQFVIAGILVLFAALVTQRVWRYATFDANRREMPPALADDEERALFLSPQGKYTLADIAANGNVLPSEKFRGFRAQHDLQPLPGDQLCPITRTKANKDCQWIVAGETYEFCCPPCIAEFVRQAKEQPELVYPVDSYVEPPVESVRSRSNP